MKNIAMALVAAVAAVNAASADVVVQMNLVDEKGIGAEPKEKDGKMVAALAAGGHLDPAKTGKHDTPWGDGHLGDLPPLYVAADGTATQPVLGPRLKAADVAARSLMGGDNHADHPAPLGGGGARVACGVVK